MNKYDVVTKYDYKGKYTSRIEADSYSVCSDCLFINFYTSSNKVVASMSIDAVQAIYKIEKDDE